MLSFIIPAHNEERWIGQCLSSIRAAMERVKEPHEIIVVDDASTDLTCQIAQQAGVRTLRVDHRQISATRNEGARVAAGEMFFFVDADTQVNEQAIREGFEILRSGAAGGGCVFDFDGDIPLWARMLHRFGVAVGRWLRMTGGCFLFCSRTAFAAAGGFSEELQMGEDLAFIQELKKVGRFVIPNPAVLTSGRKLSVVGFWESMGIVLAIACRGPHFENKRTLDLMYGARAQKCRK